jgi:hypothetical protein
VIGIPHSWDVHRIACGLIRVVGNNVLLTRQKVDSNYVGNSLAADDDFNEDQNALDRR